MAMTHDVPSPAPSGIVLLSREAADSWRQGLEPRSFDAAYQLAAVIAKTGLCGVTSPEDALARIMTGRELGLSAMQSLRGVYVVEGRPSLDASLMMSLAMQHPDCEKFEFTESTTTRAVLKVKRRGRKEQEIVWTIEDAVRAGLVKPKSNWEKYPAQMLRARCKADGGRLEFSDVLFGLASVDEVRDGSIPAVLQDGEVKAVAGTTPVPSVDVKAQTNKYQQIADALIARMGDVKSDGDLRTLRGDIKKALEDGDLTGPWADSVTEAYQKRWPKATRARAEGAAPAAPPPPAQAAPAAPPQAAPVPPPQPMPSDEVDRGDDPSAY